MSQGVFNEIRETLTTLADTNRFIISKVEKLQKSIPELAPAMNKLSDIMLGLEGFGTIANGIKQRLDGFEASVDSVQKMAVGVENIRNSLQIMENNSLSNKATIEAIKQSSDRQEQALVALSQSITQLGQLMGQILAKLG